MDLGQECHRGICCAVHQGVDSRYPPNFPAPGRLLIAGRSEHHETCLRQDLDHSESAFGARRILGPDTLLPTVQESLFTS
jgi:hypothetical protein